MNIFKLHLKIPPVVQGLAAFLLIRLCSEYFPVYRLEFVHQTALAVVISLAGLAVAVAAVAEFIRLKTSVDPHKPEKVKTLAVIGVYKYSRNPMYLGILLVLVGVTVYLGAVSAVIIVAGFVAFINRFQIEPEERVLAEKFGEDYHRYAEKVGRWM